MITDIIKGILAPAEKILDKFVPDQATKLQVQLEMQKLIYESADSAREHDKASYGDHWSGRIVDFFRGMVRPTITFTAFAYFIYMRVEGLTLPTEDYYIIGGILGFWFGGKLLSKDVQKG